MKNTKETNSEKLFKDYYNSIVTDSVWIDKNAVKQFGLRENQVVVNRFSYRRAESLHTHNFIEICYVESGTVDHYANGKKFRMRRGQLAIFPTNVTHEFVPLGEIIMSNIMFSPEILKNTKFAVDDGTDILSLIVGDLSERKPVNVLQFYGMTMVDVEHIVGRMVEEFSLKKTEYRNVMLNYLYILLIHVVRSMQEDNQICSNKASNFSKELPKILEYIETHYNKKLTLEEVAGISCYDRKYFCTLFRENIGKTFTEYIAEVRMRKAMEMLLDSDISVDSICYQVGFSDKKSFYRQFKEITGTTPARFRKSKIQDNIGETE